MTIADAFPTVLPAAPVADDPTPDLTPVPATEAATADGVEERMAADYLASVQPGRFQRALRIVWSDAADSWIVREHSPAPATVWATDWTAEVVNPHPAYLTWCLIWRPVGTLLGAVLDFLKLLLIHPARGPITVAVAAVLLLIASL